MSAFDSLNQLDKVFDTVKEGTTDLPAGNYDAILRKVELKESSTKQPMMIFEYVVTKGKLEGKAQAKFMMLANAKPDVTAIQLDMFAAECRKFGIETKQLGLQDTVKAMCDQKLLGTAVKLNIKPNKKNPEYTDITVTI